MREGLDWINSIMKCNCTSIRCSIWVWKHVRVRRSSINTFEASPTKPNHCNGPIGASTLVNIYRIENWFLMDIQQIIWTSPIQSSSSPLAARDFLPAGPQEKEKKNMWNWREMKKNKKMMMNVFDRRAEHFIAEDSAATFPSEIFQLPFSRFCYFPWLFFFFFTAISLDCQRPTRSRSGSASTIRKHLRKRTLPARWISNGCRWIMANVGPFQPRNWHFVPEPSGRCQNMS